MIKLTMPYEEQIKTLRAGDMVYITGELLVMRDAAHKKVFELINSGAKIPFDLKGRMIYYMGPCPPKNGYRIGSAGPTTSSRMDSYTPALMDMGIIGTIGKGPRSEEVKGAIIRNKGIYLSAIGGAGAYYSMTVKSSRILAFPELDAEAVRLIEVEDFPALVMIDSNGIVPLS